jgi:hypothetical protein
MAAVATLMSSPRDRYKARGITAADLLGLNGDNLRALGLDESLVVTWEAQLRKHNATLREDARETALERAKVERDFYTASLASQRDYAQFYGDAAAALRLQELQDLASLDQKKRDLMRDGLLSAAQIEEQLGAQRLAIRQKYDREIQAAEIQSQAELSKVRYEAGRIGADEYIAQIERELAAKTALYGQSEAGEKKVLEATASAHQKITSVRQDQLALLQALGELGQDTSAAQVEWYDKEIDRLKSVTDGLGGQAKALADVARLEKARQDLVLKQYDQRQDLLIREAKLFGNSERAKQLELDQFIEHAKVKYADLEEREKAINLKRVELFRTGLEQMLLDWANFSEGWDKIGENFMQGVQSTLADTFKKSFEDISSAWESLWEGLKNIVYQALAAIATKIATWGIGNLLVSAIPSLSGALGGGSLLGSVFSGAGVVSGGSSLAGLLGVGGGGAAAAYQAAFADAIYSGATAAEAMEFATLTTQGVGSGGLLASVKAGLASLGKSISATVTGWFSGAESAASAALIGESGAMAGASAGGWMAADAASLSAEFAAMGAEAGSAAASGVASGFASTMAVAAPAMVALVGAELLANAMGGVGPIGAVSEILGFSEGGGHTQQSAMQYIMNDLDLITRQVQLINQEIANGADYNYVSARFGDIAKAVEEMQLLASTAGLTTEQINQMIAAVDQSALSYANTASVIAGSLEPGLASLTETLNNTFVDANVLNGMVNSLAGSMGLVGDSALAVTSKAEGLIQQFVWGQISAEVFADGLRHILVSALQDAAQAGMDLKGVLEDIPSEVRIAVGIDMPSGDLRLSDPAALRLPTMHSGGIVTRHGGGEVPLYAHGGLGLGWPAPRPGEVDIRALAGEWVIQKPAVDYYGQDFMAAVNAMRVPVARASNAAQQTASPASGSRSNAAPVVNISFAGATFGSDPAQVATAVDRRLRATLAGMNERGEQPGNSDSMGVTW